MRLKADFEKTLWQCVYFAWSEESINWEKGKHVHGIGSDLEKNRECYYNE